MKYDCRYFQGHIPCKPNKEYDVQCDDCSYYEKDSSAIIHLDTRDSLLNEIYSICDFNESKSDDSEPAIPSKHTSILFIKLGAIGDVIRTTPLLERFRHEYGNCHFTWVTHSPQVIPVEEVDLIYKWDSNSVKKIVDQDYDVAINLDKDKEACMLLSLVDAKRKFGFLWQKGHIDTATDNAEHKLVTGFFDHISKRNRKNYLQEIFEICHFNFNGEEYKINLDEKLNCIWQQKINELSQGKTIIGLNTGCGLRWKTRLWPSDY